MIYFAGLEMKYSENIIAFKSHIGSAMKDRITWDMLEMIMESLCSSLEKSKQVNHILLAELKTYKNTGISDCKVTKDQSETKYVIDNKANIKKDLINLADHPM